MAHPRELIRKKVVEILLNKTMVACNVFASRVAPLISNSWQSELPAICVYTMDENATVFTAAPIEYKRIVDVVVEIHASADAALDDALDKIARQVETLLLADDTLDGRADNFTYARSRMVIRDDGEDLLGGCRMFFEATYYDRLPDDLFNEGLDDLNTVNTQYSLNNNQPDPADRAKTIIEDLNP